MTYKRKEVIGDCTLILGDCLEVMPTLDKVDACLTDPPYGLGKKMSGGTWATKASHYRDMHVWDLQANQEWIDAIIRLKVPSIIWGANYFIMPPSRCWLVWKKPHFPTMADCELAWCSEDCNARVFDGLRSYKEKEHPTEKPLPLMQWCIQQLPKDTHHPRPVHGKRHNPSSLRQDGSQRHRHRTRP
jgi:DNA modification methylase